MSVFLRHYPECTTISHLDCFSVLVITTRVFIVITTTRITRMTTATSAAQSPERADLRKWKLKYIHTYLYMTMYKQRSGLKVASPNRRQEAPSPCLKNNSIKLLLIIITHYNYYVTMNQMFERILALTIFYLCVHLLVHGMSLLECNGSIQ